MLESSGEDAMLIETVKNIVTQRERNESETEDDFFLVSQDQGERYPEENVEETTPHKHETKEILAWIHLCRTCANTCDNLIPIFEGEGAEHDLPSKILKYLPIHVCTVLNCQSAIFKIDYFDGSALLYLVIICFTDI